MKKLGFTLAEVLITLVIIGIIAAMTVPTLMNQTNSQEFRSAIKKAISGVNQALTLHYALSSESAQDYSSGADLIDNIFAKRMSLLTSSSNRADFTLTGKCSGTTNTFTTADGVMFCITSDFTTSADDAENGACDAYNKNPCSSNTAVGNLWIDVNGKKKPNKETLTAKRPKDVYQAMIYSQRVIPWGDATQQVMFDEGTNDN